MNSRIVYLLSFSILSVVGYSQDVIVKKDSSKITSKLTEINPQEIKYTRFDNVNGSTYVISKSEVAYVVYENGITEFFKSTDSHTSDNLSINPIPLKVSTKRPDSVGNYIKFNLQLGAVINSLSSNYTRREAQQSLTSSESYSASSGKNTYNINLGFNFFFGSSPYIKHVIGVNYLRSVGEYNYHYSQGGGYTSYNRNLHYISKIDFINVVTGLRFKIFKKLYVEPLICINIITQSDVRYSGTFTTKYSSGSPTSSVYKEETEYYSNKKVDAERSGINSTVSLCPRISYDFNLKKQTLGVYISYNLAYKFRLPWMMAGITYYPFRKLK